MIPHIPRTASNLASLQGGEELVYSEYEASEIGSGSETDSQRESESDEPDTENQAAEAQLQPALQKPPLDNEDSSEDVEHSEEDTDRVGAPKPMLASQSLSSRVTTKKSAASSTKSKAAAALSNLNSSTKKRKRGPEVELERVEERTVRKQEKMRGLNGKNKLLETQPRVLERTYLSAANAARKVRDERERAAKKAVEEASLSRKRKRGQAPLSDEIVVDEDEDGDPAAAMEVDHQTDTTVSRRSSDPLVATMRAPPPAIEESASNGEDTTPPLTKRSRGRAPKGKKATRKGIVSSIEASQPSPATTHFSSHNADEVLRKALSISRTPTSNNKSRFSEHEKTLLNRFRNEYCDMQGISHDRYNRYVQSTQRGDEIQGKEKTTFWNAIKAVLPDRDVFSLQRYMRRTFHNLTVGKWTNEDEDELEALVEENGPKWKKIAERMERTPDDVYMRYRNHIANRGKQKAKRWNRKEVDSLTEAVTSLLAISNNNGRQAGSLRSLLLENETPNVSWSQVSQLMNGARSGQQCAGKWDNLRSKAKLQKDGDGQLDLYTVKRRPGLTPARKRGPSKKIIAQESVEDTDDPIEDGSGEEGDMANVRGKLRQRKSKDPIQDEDESENGDREESGSDSESESSAAEAPSTRRNRRTKDKEVDSAQESEYQESETKDASDAQPDATTTMNEDEETSSEGESSSEEDEDSKPRVGANTKAVEETSDEEEDSSEDDEENSD